MSTQTQKVVFVTGSSSGFGRLTVETLARQGHQVFAGIRQTQTKNRATSQELQAWAAKEQLTVRVVDLDVTSEASVEQAIEAIIHQAGRLDVVVNNAGILATGPLEAYSAEQVQHLFDTNVFGVMRVSGSTGPPSRGVCAGDGFGA